MSRGLDVRGARAVIAVCEEGNYSRAARREKVTQPAITQVVHRLETDMGVQLFVYVHHRMQPTHTCEKILPLLRRLVEFADRASSLARTVHAGNEHLFRLAYTPYVNYADLTDIISTYDDHFPLGSLDLLSHYSAEAADLVLAGSADAAIVSLPVPQGDLKIRVLTRELLYVCLASTHSLASRKSVPLAALDGEAFVWVRESYHPAFFRDLLRRMRQDGYQKPRVFEVSSLAEVIFSARQGLGFALLRQSSYPGEGLVLLPIDGLELEVTTAYIYLAQNHWAPVKAFSDALGCTFQKRRPRQRTSSSKRGPALSRRLPSPATYARTCE